MTAPRYRGRVDNRNAIGSWLSGPRAAAEDMGADFGHRGERLGLPQEGAGSVASVGRRLGALFVDWGIAVLIAYGLLSGGDLRAANNERRIEAVHDQHRKRPRRPDRLNH